MSRPAKTGEKRYWLDEPRNVDKVVYTLYALCAALVAIDLLDLLDVLYHKHAHFSVENLFGFYGFYGLVGSVLLVLAAKQMRKVLMRDESYYDGDVSEGETGENADV